MTVLQNPSCGTMTTHLLPSLIAYVGTSLHIVSSCNVNMFSVFSVQANTSTPTRIIVHV